MRMFLFQEHCCSVMGFLGTGRLSPTKKKSLTRLQAALSGSLARALSVERSASHSAHGFAPRAQAREVRRSDCRSDGRFDGRSDRRTDRRIDRRTHRRTGYWAGAATAAGRHHCRPCYRATRCPSTVGTPATCPNHDALAQSHATAHIFSYPPHDDVTPTLERASSLVRATCRLTCPSPFPSLFSVAGRRSLWGLSSSTRSTGAAKWCSPPLASTRCSSLLSMAATFCCPSSSSSSRTVGFTVPR